MKALTLLFIYVSVSGHTFSQPDAATSILPGAERMNVYLPLLKGKRIGIFANQTSTVGTAHLVDTLRKSGIDIKVIFGPEHGFRGKASAGEKVGNYTDETTGIPVISLYGSKKRPTAQELKEVDLLVFDIQDVGVRFIRLYPPSKNLWKLLLNMESP